MLNGTTYSNLVKYLWVRVEIFDQYEADKELRLKQEESEKNKGKTHHELGLNE